MALLTDATVITVAWLYLVFFPGWLLSRLTSFANDDLVSSLVVAFVLGLTICTPVLLLGYAAALPIGWIATALAAIPPILILALRKSWARLRLPITRADTLLLGIAVLLGILALVSKAYHDHTSDSVVHLALIRRIVESGRFGLHIFDHLRPLPGEQSTQSWMLAGSYSYSAWYGIVAIVAYVSRTDPVQVWGYFPLFFGILNVSVFWLLGRIFLHDDRKAAAAVLAVLLFGWTASAMRASPYPNHTVHFVMFVALCFSLAYARDGERRHAIAAVATGTALVAIHPQGFFQFGLLLIGALIGCAIIKDLRPAVPRLLLAGVAIVLFSAPVILLKSQLMSEYATDMNFIMDTYRRDVGLSDSLYLLDVRPMLRENPLVWFLFSIALITQVRSLIRARTVESAFLLGGIGILLFIAFNPVVYPLVSEHLSPVMARRTLGPLVWLFGPLLLARWLGSFPVRTTLLATVAFVFVTASAGMAIVGLPRSLTKIAYRLAPMLTANPVHAKAHDARYCGGERPPCLLDVMQSPDWTRIREKLTYRSNVVADSRTTRLLAAVASVDPVALYFARTPTEKTRLHDAESVLSNAAGSSAILTRYDVEYVIQARGNSVYELYIATPQGLRLIDRARH